MYTERYTSKDALLTLCYTSVCCMRSLACAILSLKPWRELEVASTHNGRFGFISVCCVAAGLFCGAATSLQLACVVLPCGHQHMRCVGCDHSDCESGLTQPSLGKNWCVGVWTVWVCAWTSVLGCVNIVQR